MTQSAEAHFNVPYDITEDMLRRVYALSQVGVIAIGKDPFVLDLHSGSLGDLASYDSPCIPDQRSGEVWNQRVEAQSLITSAALSLLVQPRAGPDLYGVIRLEAAEGEIVQYNLSRFARGDQPAEWCAVLATHKMVSITPPDSSAATLRDLPWFVALQGYGDGKFSIQAKGEAVVTAALDVEGHVPLTNEEVNPVLWCPPIEALAIPGQAARDFAHHRS